MPWHCRSHYEREWADRPRDREPKRPSIANSIRSTARWQTFRLWVLRRRPLCEDPLGLHALEGRAQVAEHVHHIVPIAADPDLAFVASNCQALCRACHAAIEARAPSTEAAHGANRA